jgi:hypothetical protein
LTAGAQEYLYEIGGGLGSSFYMGDANKNAAFRNMNAEAGAMFRYNANFRIAFKGDLLWTRLTGTTVGQENVYPGNAEATFDRQVIDFGGQGEFNFFPFSDKYKFLYTKRVSPYIAGGFGLTVSPGGGATVISPYLTAGTGVKYKLKNRINIGAELSARKSFSDRLDIAAGNELLNSPYGINSSPLKNKDWYIIFAVTVTYDFGLRNCNCNKKDMDKK